MLKTPFGQNTKDRMIDNPDNYKWGIFYYNTRDSRIILPKQNRWMGWTLNFANTYSYIILVGILLLFAGIVVYAMMMERL